MNRFFKIFILSIVFFASANTCFAAASFDSSGSGFISSGATITWSHTVGAGSNRLLVVGVSYDGRNGAVVSGVTYSGFPLTFIRRDSNPARLRYVSELWYLTAPTTGTANIIVTLSLSIAKPGIGGSASFMGVDQITSVSNNNGAWSSGAGEPSVVVISAVDDMVIDNVADYKGTSLTVGAGQTQRWQTGVSGTEIGAGSTEVGSASVTMSWTGTAGSGWSISATNIKAFVPPDTTVPSSVSDLAILGATQTTIDLGWTAPGDDATTGTATTYDIRYSTSNITNDTDFNNATLVTGEPTPSIAGTTESMTVTGLSQNTTYYFAIKTSDEVPNTSALSNVPTGTTAAVPDTTVPSSVSDLAILGATQTTIDLGWTAPGDDATTGTATTYDIRYSTSNITNDTDFNNATLVTGEPTPSIAGTTESMTVTGLSQNTTYYFAIKTSDEVPNTSALSNVPTGTTLEGSTIIIIPSAGGGVVTTRIYFSGQAFPGSKVKVLIKSDLDSSYKNIPVSSYLMKENGEFSLEYLAFLTGNYFVALNVIDKDGQETGFLSFNVDFRSEPSLIVENIFIPPTISFKKESITLGDNFNIVGYSSPNSSVELRIDDVVKTEIEVGSSGYYTYSIGTKDLEKGIHYIKARQIRGVDESSFSFPKVFKISELENTKADFNNDNKVNITDWSVFLFRWGSDNNSLKSKIDLDDNGIINIVDFSIFLKSIKI